MEVMPSLTCFQLYDLFNKTATPEGQLEIIVKLQEWRLIPREETYLCPNGHPYKLSRASNSIDGWVWRCTRKVSIAKQKARVCGTSVSIRKHTYMEKSQLPIRDIMLFIYFWVHMTPTDFIKRELRLSNQTVACWGSSCRQVIIEKLLNNKNKIGGPEKIVEIDEFKFRQPKCHRGHPIGGKWILAGYESVSGKCILYPVEKGDVKTFLTVIKNNIKPGTTVISGFWKTYDCLQNEEFKHLRVNNLLDFKNPETGAHTNNIESTWRHVKMQLPQYCRKNEFFFGHLAKFIFLKQCRSKDVDPFYEFIEWVAQLYNPLEPRLPETESSERIQTESQNESDTSDIEIDL